MRTWVYALFAWLCAGPAGAAEPPRVVTIASEGKEPQVAIGRSGAVHVAFGLGNRVLCSSSTDGGKTFAPPVTVSDRGVLSLGMRRGPRIAAGAGAVVIAAVVGETGGGRDGDVLAWRSTDDGISWSPPTRLNTKPGSAREGLHALVAGPRGSIYCAWLDLRNDRTELFGAGSEDFGKTWKSDGLIYRSPEKSICQCCHPSLAFGPDGTLFAMWRNNLKGARDMYLARSTDMGATFTPAEKLGLRTWVLDICPMDGGSLAVGDDGEVCTTWTRAGEVFQCRPGSPEKRLGPGAQPWTASGAAGPALVWVAERRPGKVKILSSGRKAQSSPIEIGGSNASDPVVAIAPGSERAFAAWEDSGSIKGASFVIDR